VILSFIFDVFIMIWALGIGVFFLYLLSRAVSHGNREAAQEEHENRSYEENKRRLEMLANNVSHTTYTLQAERDKKNWNARVAGLISHMITDEEQAELDAGKNPYREAKK